MGIKYSSGQDSLWKMKSSFIVDIKMEMGIKGEEDIIRIKLEKLM